VMTFIMMIGTHIFILVPAAHIVAAVVQHCRRRKGSRLM